MHRIKTTAKVPMLEELRIPASLIMETQKFEIAPQQELTMNFRICSKDPMGFAAVVFGNFLTYENAKNFLPEEVTEDEYTFVSDVEEGVQDMLDYLVFALETCKKLITGEINTTTVSGKLIPARNVTKLGAYLMCLGRQDLYVVMNNKNIYHPFGIPCLREVCSIIGVDFPKELIKVIG